MKRPISMLGRLLPPTREEDVYVDLDGATGSLTAFQFTPKVLSDPFTCINREGSKFDTPWSPALGNGIEIRVERGIGKAPGFHNGLDIPEANRFEWPRKRAASPSENI